MNSYGSVDPGALAALSVAYFAFFVIFYVWMALALSKVFTKLGEQGFKAWVPILNNITIFQLGSVNPLWILVFLVPFVNIVGVVMMIIAINNINKRFGKGAGMTVLAIFFSPIWASILGFGSAVPIGGAPRAAVAPQAAFTPPAAAASAAPAAWSAVPAAPPAPPAPAAAPFAPPAAPVPPAPPQAVSAPPAPPAAPEVPPIVVTDPPAAPAAAASNPWAPPISGVPGLDLNKPAAEVVVPPLVEPIPSPVSNSVVNSVNTSAQVAELQPTAEDENPDFDKTVVAPRKKKESWTIVPEGGAPITLTKAAALLGRNPSSTAADTQLVSVPDPSKTVSKTHARLTLADGVWTIVDLNSTNGVYLLSAAGDETEVEAGVPTTVGSSFRLGDLTIQISKD